MRHRRNRPAPSSVALAIALGPVLSGAALSAAAAASCQARSGERFEPLVELYTSEGCSSCPPAEQAFARLRQEHGNLAALALHVDYWDYLGWHDPYAQAAFTDRHRWLVQANGHQTVYTPHFFVNGIELRDAGPALEKAIDRGRRQVPQAQLELSVSRLDSGTAQAQARANSSVLHGAPALFLALAQDGLVSRVTRGENGGATLAHAHVVRAWTGPVPLVGGSAIIRRDWSGEEAAEFARGALVAFVQEQETGRVLQALELPACRL